jgi:hypothetical protein
MQKPSKPLPDPLSSIPNSLQIASKTTRFIRIKGSKHSGSTRNALSPEFSPARTFWPFLGMELCVRLHSLQFTERSIVFRTSSLFFFMLGFFGSGGSGWVLRWWDFRWASGVSLCNVLFSCLGGFRALVCRLIYFQTR